MNEARLTRLEAAAVSLEETVERFECALVGDELGHKGVLPRLDQVEKQQRIQWFAFPLLVAGGAAIGQTLARYLTL